MDDNSFLEKYWKIRKKTKDIYENHATKKVFKELHNTEIESKLEVKYNHNETFNNIKNLFKNKEISGFKIPSHFSFTIISGSINKYYKKDGKILKEMIKRDGSKIVEKSPGEKLDNSYKLDCIIKRSEVKGIRKPTEENKPLLDSAKTISKIYRERKAFWIEKINNRRIYQITLDKCTYNKKILYQIEIEFVGSYIERNETKYTEKEVIEDIAYLTDILLKKFPNIKESYLTKERWSLSN